MSWPDLADWWLGEIAGDPAYEEVVTPLLLEILQPEPDAIYLDLGAGEGRIGRSVEIAGATVIGVDLAELLARESKTRMVVADVSHSPLGDSTVDGGYAVLVLEHLADYHAFFSETARMVRPEGVLAIVSNHPVWTAPCSTPIQDTDGEILWRPGDYFTEGTTEVPVKGGMVRFHHRPLSLILTAAAGAGWSLEAMIERPHHELESQSGIPRLLACRWRLLP